MAGKQKKEKINRLKLIKYTTLLLSFMISITVLAVVDLKPTSDFAGTTRVELNFSTDANLDQVAEKTKDISEYEKIEKVNSAQIVIDFVDLDAGEETLNNKYSEIEGFSSLSMQQINLVSKDFQRVHWFVYFALPVFAVFEYMFLSAIERSRDKISLLFAFFVQNIFAITLLLSILFSLSRVYPISYELMIFFVTVITGRLMIDVILLFKINLAASTNSQENFPKLVEEFVLNYDRNFVIVALFSTIVLLPMVLVASDPLPVGILLGSFVALNILLETFVFADLIYFFNHLIVRIPVVRDLKWSRK